MRWENENEMDKKKAPAPEPEAAWLHIISSYLYYAHCSPRSPWPCTQRGHVDEPRAPLPAQLPSSHLALYESQYE